LWEKLQERYEKVDMQLSMLLKDKMSEIQRKDCKSLDEYVLKKTEIFHRLQDVNEPISTLEQVQQLLKGLDSKYTPFKTVMCNSAETETVDMLVTKLRNHEIGTL
jgi:hypothetical protein